MGVPESEGYHWLPREIQSLLPDPSSGILGLSNGEPAQSLRPSEAGLVALEVS